MRGVQWGGWQEVIRSLMKVRVVGMFVVLSGAAWAGAAADLPAEWRAGFARIEAEMADRAWCGRVADQAEHPAALIAAEDRDPLDVVLRRTGALLDHLTRLPGAPDLGAEGAELDRLRSLAQGIAVENGKARYAAYESACRLRRAIAFRNPLLDFDRILFLTKHRPMRGDHHMVDQYCAFNARPGGALQVLEGPFSDQPSARDLMADRTIRNGRLKGRPLTGGAFNTLELGYDGEEILFAWSECGPMPADPDWSTQPFSWTPERAKKNRREHYFWTPERTFHVFRTSVDDDGVDQLTDGAWNDFDPCFLPNGRIAFISERRGGYLRCGGNRPNPTYTLFGMMGDGSDIIPLSFHETHEWNPSVDHDGMIAYSRWDYVDRDNDGAHHLWTCYPDGRDPRSFHGNYPDRREARPWMELSIRAVPGSRRYVAVAAAHHGYNYGSLVLIDPSREDDNAMSQVKRLTPEAHLPESESAPGKPHAKGRHQPNGEVYGTPWPLSEAFHLCVYDPGKRHYGIYLIDCFGNKELLWRDPEIACLDPIPLRPRPRPPVIPTATCQARAEQRPDSDPRGTVAILDVYQSDFEWPEGVKIDAIRVVRLFPKSTYHLDEPMVGAGIGSLARGVVGTAPVEEDGSVHFEVPTGAPIYFQVLDEQGLAIQSMRSATYVHPGERLSCVGCHEPKSQAPPGTSAVPLAWRRPPSVLEPEHEEAMPLSFPRLVQPVLDEHCVGCHAEAQSVEAGAPDLSGRVTGPHGWTAGFVSLEPFAWAWNGGNGIIFKEGSRSVAGEIGARVATLYQMLEQGHHEVRLDPEELRRLTIWLDCNSNFYGAYRQTREQAEGGRVEPLLR